MAIAVDQASLGTAEPAGASTAALTTSAAVASGGFVILGVWWFSDSQTITGVSDNGPGLTWNIALQGQQTVSSADFIGLVWAQAPSGMSSGTTITVTWDAAVSIPVLGAASFTGVATSSPVEVTDGPLDSLSTASWASSSDALSAGSMLFGLRGSDGGTGNTATHNEAFKHFNAGDGYGIATDYRIEASAGSYTVGGTQSASSSGQVGAIAVLAAAGGGTNATVDMTGVLASATGAGLVPTPGLAFAPGAAAAAAAVVAPPKPRPASPFSEINVRL